MSSDEAKQICEELAAKLSEHFEAVQILVSWNEDGSTQCVKRGCGNFYARRAMASEFVEEDMAQIQAHEIVERLDPPDTSEAWK
jgi:hypothetical protein